MLNHLYYRFPADLKPKIRVALYGALVSVLVILLGTICAATYAFMFVGNSFANTPLTFRLIIAVGMTGVVFALLRYLALLMHWKLRTVFQDSNIHLV